MAGMMRKGMSWLGLGPRRSFDDYVDELDDHDDFDAPDGVDYDDPTPAAPGSAAGPWRWPAPRIRPTTMVAVSPVRSGCYLSRRAVRRTRARPQCRAATPGPFGFASPPRSRHRRSNNHTQEVGDRFKRNDPVIINLQGLDRDLTARLLDFSSGVTYGLGGHVERIASHVYLLTPADVEVSNEDRERITGELARA